MVILNHISSILKPGRTTLLLGPPAAGQHMLFHTWDPIVLDCARRACIDSTMPFPQYAPHLDPDHVAHREINPAEVARGQDAAHQHSEGVQGIPILHAFMPTLRVLFPLNVV